MDQILNLECRRLTIGDQALAGALFSLMSDIFGEQSSVLGDDHLSRLLGDEAFWVIAVLCGTELLGGLTAHVIPMTRSEMSEIFIYDVAVAATHRGLGVGRMLVEELLVRTRNQGIPTAFVLADSGDVGAIDFYRAVGGEASPVTLFNFVEG